LDALYICVLEQGAGRFVLPGLGEPKIGNSATGLIYYGEPGIRGALSDSHLRLVVRLPTRSLHQRLEALLDGQQVATVAFQPVFDQTRGAGATVRRLVDFLFAELEHSDSLLTNEIAIRSFEENLALSLLLGLPHNYTERLHRQKTAAAPGHVRRAEAYMRANACMPLTIAEIAAAAGCSVRALQAAFQRFRGTTPMRVLQQARLEQARAEMLRPGQTLPLVRIAAAHGFSNPARFAQQFRRRYGLYPSEMLRTRRDPVSP
jgi:AraC-like DNA-binding protein